MPRQANAVSDMQAMMDDAVSPAMPERQASPVQRDSAVEAPDPSIRGTPSAARVRELAEMVLAETSAAPEPEPEPSEDDLAKEEEERDRRAESPCDQFHYGKIYFVRQMSARALPCLPPASGLLSVSCSCADATQEETGKTAQYLIVPKMHSPEDVIAHMARFMRAPEAASDDSNDSENSMICKPSILFEVRARGMSYMDEAQDVIKNKYLHEQWFGGPEDSDAITDEDQMVRKFCDRTLDVFKDVVKGVANADGWFMNSAGRGASHQLIGDCIETYDALESTTWLNFASLDNPELFAAKKGAGQVHETGENGERDELHGEALHSYLVKELRKRSVAIPKAPEEGEKEIKLPHAPDAVTYKAPETPFPTLADLQGSKGSDSLAQWLKKQMDALGTKKEMHIHPQSTHFIFFVRLRLRPLLTRSASTSLGLTSCVYAVCGGRKREASAGMEGKSCHGIRSTIYETS
eukprot:COSAG02_NODE_4887_length_4863_cov_3.936818_5_plen_465_part_00